MGPTSIPASGTAPVTDLCERGTEALGRGRVMGLFPAQGIAIVGLKQLRKIGSDIVMKKLVPMTLIVGLLEAANDAESVDALLGELVESGRISDEQAEVLRTQVLSDDHTALDQLWVHSYEEERGAGSRLEGEGGKGISCREYGERMADIFGVDGHRVAHTIGRAHAGLYAVERGIGDNGAGEAEESAKGPYGRHAEILNAS